MTFDEALEQAVLGERVRAVNMMPGAYVNYNFDGWRINTPGGSSSGYTFRDIDKESEWEICTPIYEPKLVERKPWAGLTDRLNPPAPDPLAMVKKQRGVVEEPKRGRPKWQPPAEINDIDDVKPSPWASLKPANAWPSLKKD